jgi:hypothetical protein
VGAGGGSEEAPDDDDETGTSVEDLTTTADPGTFDQTFTDDDAELRIQGEYEPVAGRKQVIPRIAYVLNYNLVYNETRERWEPQKKVSNAGGAGVEVIGVAEETVQDGTFMAVRTDVSDRFLGGDTIKVGVTYQDGAPGNDTTFTNVVSPSSATGAVGYNLGYEDSFGGWFVDLFNDTGSSIDLRVTVYRITVPDDVDSLRTV